MKEMNIEQFDWDKVQGLLPAIIQDVQTHRVLMLGYMDRAALQQTLDSHTVTFFSRSKQRLWTKGETSGHTLHWVDIIPDCDQDSVLIMVEPQGPTCHLDRPSCFKEARGDPLAELEKCIAQRERERPEGSYTAELFSKGKPRIAQKFGEEAVEVTIAALAQSKQELIAETADLLYHLLVLLRVTDTQLTEVFAELQRRG